MTGLLAEPAVLRYASLPLQGEPLPRGMLTVRIAPGPRHAMGYIARVRIGGHPDDHQAAASRAAAMRRGETVVIYGTGLTLTREEEHLLIHDPEIILDTTTRSQT